MSLKFDGMLGAANHIYDTEIDSVLNFGAKTCNSMSNFDSQNIV